MYREGYMGIRRMIIPIKYTLIPIVDEILFETEIDDIKISVRTVTINNPGSMDLYDYQVISKVFELNGYIKGYDRFLAHEAIEIMKPTNFLIMDLEFYFNAMSFRSEKNFETDFLLNTMNELFLFDLRSYSIDYSIIVNSEGLEVITQKSTSLKFDRLGARNNPEKILERKGLSDQLLWRYKRQKYLNCSQMCEYSNRVTMCFDLYSKALYESKIRNKFLLAMIAIEALFKKDFSESQKKCKNRIIKYLEANGLGKKIELNELFYNIEKESLGFFQIRNYVAHGDTTIDNKIIATSFKQLIPMLHYALEHFMRMEVKFIESGHNNYFEFIDNNLCIE